MNYEAKLTSSNPSSVELIVTLDSHLINFPRVKDENNNYFLTFFKRK